MVFDYLGGAESGLRRNRDQSACYNGPTN
jgi:hypothetical protein